MLAGRGDFSDFGILTTLKTQDEGVNIGAKVEAVLARRLLASAPSRISVRVDVGTIKGVSKRKIMKISKLVNSRPEIKTSTTVVVEGSCLSTHDLSNSSDELVVESRAHGDRLREGGCITELSSRVEGHARRFGNTVQGLVPPLVDRQAESWYSGAVVSCEVELFGDCEG